MQVETTPKPIPPAEAPVRDFIFIDAAERETALLWAVEVLRDAKPSNTSMKRAAKILIANSPDREAAGRMMLALATANERLDAMEQELRPSPFMSTAEAAEFTVPPKPYFEFESRLHLSEAYADMQAQSAVPPLRLPRLDNPAVLVGVGVLSALALAMIVAPVQMAELVVQASAAVRALF